LFTHVLQPFQCKSKVMQNLIATTVTALKVGLYASSKHWPLSWLDNPSFHHPSSSVLQDCLKKKCLQEISGSSYVMLCIMAILDTKFITSGKSPDQVMWCSTSWPFWIQKSLPLGNLQIKLCDALHYGHFGLPLGVNKVPQLGQV
jgi:hypothetical protein